MDHVVYLDAKAEELESLLSGQKTMVIRGATGRKLPYGRVRTGDVLFFINNNAEGVIRAYARVKSVINSEPLCLNESEKLINSCQNRLRLTDAQMKRWTGKRYLVLVEVENIQPLDPFPIDKSDYGNMDNWLPVGDINRVKLQLQPAE